MEVCHRIEGAWGGCLHFRWKRVITSHDTLMMIHARSFRLGRNDSIREGYAKCGQHPEPSSSSGEEMC